MCKLRRSQLEWSRIEVRNYLCSLISLICSPQEQLAPTVEHEVISYQAIRTLSRMVSTRSRAGTMKHPEACPIVPANTTPDLAAILEVQAKMQQELTDLKKHNADEMEALRQENSRLRRKIEADLT